MSSTSPTEHAAEPASYAPYAQLVKMLAPSTGCIALYDVEGDLIWCSDGFERPDLREIVDALHDELAKSGANKAGVRKTSTGLATFASLLNDADAKHIGSVIVELGHADEASVSSAVTLSLLRPVLECLQTRVALEQAVARGDAASRESTPVESPHGAVKQDQSDAAATQEPDHLDMLLAIDDSATTGMAPLQQLVTQCVASMECVGGALVIPEKDISVVADGEFPDGEQILDRTRRHLLAWAQLNNRPMVVNRVASDQAPYKILSCPVRNAEQRVTGLLALFRSAEAENFEIRDVRILEFMSRKAVGILNNQHDPLTGLIGRSTFERRVQVLLDQATASHTILFVDIDRLQLINEAFGYQAGDEVIQRLAEVVRSELGEDDLATRVGSDCFAILLPGRDQAAANAIAAAILDAMSRLGYLKGSESVPVSVSIGLAVAASNGAEVRHLVAAAELACKKAKQLGGARLEVCTQTGSDDLARRSELLASAHLQQALKNNEFRLEAQPIFGLGDSGKQTLGFEILVRMRDSDGHLVAPDKFIDAAERYGLMPALDRWVVSATVRTLADASSLLEELPLGICINVSSQTLGSEDFPAFVLREIEQAGLSPKAFCFELKESTAVNQMQKAERFIAAFGQAGCSVALDDFGRALTSLAHLKRLKVSYLKIDGSLARRVLDDVHSESMVRGLSKAAQTLGIKTIAEHVESEALAVKLAELEVDFGQGFYYGRPQPLVRALSEGHAPRRAASAVVS